MRSGLFGDLDTVLWPWPPPGNRRMNTGVTQKFLNIIEVTTSFGLESTRMELGAFSDVAQSYAFSQSLVLPGAPTSVGLFYGLRACESFYTPRVRALFPVEIVRPPINARLLWLHGSGLLPQ